MLYFKAEAIPLKQKVGSMKKEKVFKIIKYAGCVLCSIFLVALLSVTPFYYSVTAFTKPKEIAKIVQNIDYQEVIEQNPTIKKSLKSYGLNGKQVQEIIESKEAGEMIEIYADQAVNILLQLPDDQAVDLPFIKKAVSENLNDVLEIVEDETQLKLNKKRIKTDVITFIDQNEQAVEQTAPIIEGVRQTVKTIHASGWMKNSINIWTALILTAVCFGIGAVIISLMRSKGFIWMGVNFFIITLLIGAATVFSSSPLLLKAAFKISNFGSEVLESAISISKNSMLLGIFAGAIFTVLFIGFYFILHFLKKKYQATPLG